MSRSTTRRGPRNDRGARAGGGPRAGRDARANRLELGRDVMDKGVEDRGGGRCGKVDDLVLDVPDGGSPTVVGLVTGPLAFAGTLGPRVRAIVRLVYRALGVRNPRPVEIPWSAVAQIDVVVHVDVDGRKLGVHRLGEAVGARFIGRLPGGGN